MCITDHEEYFLKSHFSVNEMIDHASQKYPSTTLCIMHGHINNLFHDKTIKLHDPSCDVLLHNN